ncbi:hypothetical protein [Plantactinospora sp. GCM10030261]|uniref:hypothetical protein n=1 Tax=Plantactinospora sp. GCM10030261 TaxID=3273420 RepID=UPI0036202CBE
MRTPEVVIEGLAGPLIVDVTAFGGPPTVCVSGEPVPRVQDTYLLPLANGGQVAGRLRRYALDPYPTIEIDGEKHRTGPAVPVGLRILALLPLALVGLGGLVGGLFGIAGLASNMIILRKSWPVVTRAAAMAGVLAVAATLALAIPAMIAVALD